MYLVQIGSAVVLVCQIVYCFGRLDVIEGDVCKQEDGKTWTCKSIPDCQFPLNVLEDESQEPPFCEFNGSNPIVCCDPDFAVGKSNNMCKKYSEAVFKNLSKDRSTSIDTCADVDGLSKPSKGGNALPRKYPQLALIGYGNDSSIHWAFAGSLISDLYVLGAANINVMEFRPRWIQLGGYNQYSGDDETDCSTQPVTYEVQEVVMHPEFKPPSMYNDIALYKLNATVQLNKYIRPICLQKGHEVREDSLSVAGRGPRETGGAKSSIVQDVKVKVVKTRMCKEHFKNTFGLDKGVREDSMICVGVSDYEGNVCTVESGGPLMQRLKEPYCMYSLVGIATSAHLSCNGTAPGVFTRVSKYVSWIEAIVWP